MSTHLDVRVGTANIKGYLPMRQRRVRADLKKMYDTGLQLMANQEMWLPRYRRPLRSLRPKFRHQTPLRRSPCTSWDSARFIEIRREVLTLHKAVRGACDRRQIVAVWLKDTLTGFEFCFISTHPVPAPWKTRVRQSTWDVGRDTLIRFITAQVAAGYPMIVGVDAQQPGTPFGTTITIKSKTYTMHYVNHFIDHLIFIDAPGYSWHPSNRQVLPLNSDHDGLVCDVRLTRAA